MHLLPPFFPGQVSHPAYSLSSRKPFLVPVPLCSLLSVSAFACDLTLAGYSRSYNCIHAHALKDYRVPTFVAFLLSDSHVSVDILFVFIVRNLSLRKAEGYPASRKGKQGMVWLCGSPVHVSHVTPFPQPLLQRQLVGSDEIK